jgi:hypothetical protein
VRPRPRATNGSHIDRGRALLLKEDEFLCPSKGDVRGKARRDKAALEKFDTAPDAIKRFKTVLLEQLKARFFSKKQMMLRSCASCSTPS